MSVGPFSGPVERPSNERDLAELFRRVEALERVKPGAGDYVFLNEVVLDATSDPLSFASIDQGYQHLVLELLLQQDPTNATGDAWIRANDWSGGTDWRQIASDDTSGPLDSGTTDDVGVRLDDIIPVTPATDPLFAMVTVKFPYYSLDDVVKGCYWQAVSINDGDDNVIAASGGGMFVYHVDDEVDGPLKVPITELEVNATGSAQFAAGTRGQLYGIKKH